MNVAEFRIGNLLHDREGRLCKVDKIEDSPVYRGGTSLSAPATVGPITALPHRAIRLTKESLLKIKGVKNNGSNLFWLSVSNLKSELHFEIVGDEVVTTLKGQFCDLILDRIEFIHQLQNLFYALTLEELVWSE